MNLLRLFKRKPEEITTIKQKPLLSKEESKELRDDTAKIFKPRLGVQQRRQFGSIESLPPTLKPRDRENLDWLMDRKPKRWWEFWRKR